MICKVAKGTKDDVDAAVEAAHVGFFISVNLHYNIQFVLNKTAVNHINYE